MNMERATSIIKLEPGVSQVIKSFLSAKGVHQAIRIELKTSGCCDASLGLHIGTISDSDLIMESDGLKFIIARETYQLVGEVTISYVDEPLRKGFILTSSKPVSEWDGFAVTEIEI
jgi:Fe-S cluster assembly iron-binding protein IscA